MICVCVHSMFLLYPVICVKRKTTTSIQTQIQCTPHKSNYTLSHLENDCDVSAYSGGRRLLSRAQLVCFLTRSKRLMHKGCVLQRVFLDTLSDVTVVLGMRQSIGYLVFQYILFSRFLFHQPLLTDIPRPHK